jgi:lipoprotein-anchoring transpeptidase ErfK/SrfK
VRFSGARPDSPITVTVADGTLAGVTVRGAGTVEGTLDATRTHWTSSGSLTPDARYTVTATAKTPGGKTSQVTSAFTTLKPAKTLAVTDVTPDMAGENVGVGAPIIVHFNRTVTNKAAVEKQLKVTAQKPVEGAWRWISGDQVVYRTKTYWPAHQTVTLKAELAGVASGGGAYGTKNVTKTITIGSAQISTVNVKTRKMTVTRDGKVVRTFSISAGRGTTTEYTTTSGVHLAMDRERTVTMTSPGHKPGDPGYYKSVEHYAVRFSNSGEFVHQGEVPGYNMSHGCVHAESSNAQWFYGIMQRGDVIKVTGTSRQVAWNNGWSYWQLSFAQWAKGSALA